MSTDLVSPLSTRFLGSSLATVIESTDVELEQLFRWVLKYYRVGYSLKPRAGFPSFVAVEHIIFFDPSYIRFYLSAGSTPDLQAGRVFWLPWIQG